MSEDNHWRQLGSIVNGVLSETRAKSIRGGSMTPVTHHFTVKKVQIDNVLPAEKMGNGFLSPEMPAAPRPVQLELPFGITAAPHANFGVPASPRGARLM